MRTGKDALRAATYDTGGDQVAHVVEDITKSLQVVVEINEQLAQPYEPQMDEDELRSELAELESEL